MSPTVYIETTIPSYYCDSRADLIRDIERTRDWWDMERGLYECFTSFVVIDELQQGDYPGKQRCLDLVRNLPLLDVTGEVEEVADAYRTHRLMPRPPVRDALHVAVASVYRLDYLLTWNCEHLANANKAVHLEKLNARLHLGLPRLVTPNQLRPFEEYA